MRSGADYRAALKDDREIYLDGERVHDVTNHPAFAPIATTMGELFDIAANPANEMRYHSPEIDDDANRVFSIPRSRTELTAFRQAVETWARHTHGWVGRSPDHVGAFLAGFAAHPRELPHRTA